MPKKHTTLITMDPTGDRIEAVRLTNGAKLQSPSMVPNRRLDAAAREVLSSLGWTRVPARLDLWYAPCHRGTGLIDLAHREKAELDKAARDNGVRLSRERALKRVDQIRGTRRALQPEPASS